MNTIDLVLLFSLFWNLAHSSLSRDRISYEADHEISHSKLNESAKRARKVSLDTEMSTLSLSFSDIGLSEKSVVNLDYTGVEYDDLYSRFVEIIKTGALGSFIELHKRELLPEVLDKDMIDFICKQDSLESIHMLDYILRNVEFIWEDLEIDLNRWLVICTGRSFEKFELFWDRFDGSTLGGDLQEVLVEAVIKEDKKVIDYIMIQIISNEELVSRLNESTLLSLMRKFDSIKHLSFAARQGFDFKTLPHGIKRSLLQQAARANNVFLTEILLEDPEIREILKATIIFLMAIIIRHDCLEILDLYLGNTVTLTEIRPFVPIAIKQKKPKLIDFFERIGFIDSKVLTECAIEAIIKKDLESFKFIISLGFDPKSRVNGFISFLGFAVSKDAIDIVKHLIELEEMDVDIVEEIEDGDHMIFVSLLFYSRSHEMIRYLVSKGLDLNFIFTKINTKTAEMVSFTTMLHLCARSCNESFFKLLLELGASDEILDNEGESVKTLLPKSGKGYVLDPHNLG